jgi:hypothetical protein
MARHFRGLRAQNQSPRSVRGAESDFLRGGAAKVSGRNFPFPELLFVNRRCAIARSS